MISNADFLYIGFDDRQIRLLENEDDDTRRLVYEEGLRLLMEAGPSGVSLDMSSRI